MLLEIASIRLDFQGEECLDPETVGGYITDIQAEALIVPVEVYFDGRAYWLADGFHRIAAAQACGRKQIEAVITPGSYDDLEREWNKFIAALRNDLTPK